MMVIGVLDHSHDGGADRTFRGFNRRDRVFAKDSCEPVNITRVACMPAQ
jgi:hypothetical protein